MSTMVSNQYHGLLSVSKEGYMLMDFAIMGGNLEIIRTCDQYKLYSPKQLLTSIKVFQNEVCAWLLDTNRYDEFQLIDAFKEAINVKNIHALILLIDHSPQNNNFLQSIVEYCFEHNNVMFEAIVTNPKVDISKAEPYGNFPLNLAILENECRYRNITEAKVNESIKIIYNEQPITKNGRKREILENFYLSNRDFNRGSPIIRKKVTKELKILLQDPEKLEMVYKNMNKCYRMKKNKNFIKRKLKIQNEDQILKNGKSKKSKEVLDNMGHRNMTQRR